MVKHHSLDFPCQSTIIVNIRLAEGWHLRLSCSARARMRKAHVTIHAHDDRGVVSPTICDLLPSFGKRLGSMSLLR